MQKQAPEFAHLVGVDEVGRGSLICSVVAAAVCLPKSLSKSERALLSKVNDSKKLNAQAREELSASIRGFCLVGIGEADLAEIESLNIHYASLLAAYRAFENLCDTQLPFTINRPNTLLLMDGRALLPDIPKTHQRAIIKGDGQSASIAAASIVAKHYRDTAIMQMAQQFPGYGWERNMGYATPEHLQGIQEHGITPHHRRNFRLSYPQLKIPLIIGHD